MTTRRKYFMQNPDKFYDYVWKWRVFCNPPYSKIKLWAQKCYQESQKPNTLVVMLVPARTDTRWFHDYVYHKAKLRFLKGRTKFVKDDGEQSDSAPFPSMIAIYGGGNE